MSAPKTSAAGEGSVDELVREVQSLRTQLEDWKNDLMEEFSEMTGLLIDHFEDVIDKHLSGKPCDHCKHRVGRPVVDDTVDDSVSVADDDKPSDAGSDGSESPAADEESDDPTDGQALAEEIEKVLVRVRNDMNIDSEVD